MFFTAFVFLYFDQTSKTEAQTIHRKPGTGVVLLGLAKSKYFISITFGSYESGPLI